MRGSPMMRGRSRASRTGNRATVAALNQYHEPLGRMTVALASNRNHDTNGDGDFGDEPWTAPP